MKARQSLKLIKLSSSSTRRRFKKITNVTISCLKKKAKFNKNVEKLDVEYRNLFAIYVKAIAAKSGKTIYDVLNYN